MYYRILYCGVSRVLIDGRSSRFPLWRHPLRTGMRCGAVKRRSLACVCLVTRSVWPRSSTEGSFYIVRHKTVRRNRRVWSGDWHWRYILYRTDIILVDSVVLWSKRPAMCVCARRGVHSYILSACQWIQSYTGTAMWSLRFLVDCLTSVRCNGGRMQL